MRGGARGAQYNIAPIRDDAVMAWAIVEAASGTISEGHSCSVGLCRGRISRSINDSRWNEGHEGNGNGRISALGRDDFCGEIIQAESVAEKMTSAQLNV